MSNYGADIRAQVTTLNNGRPEHPSAGVDAAKSMHHDKRQRELSGAYDRAVLSKISD